MPAVPNLVFLPGLACDADTWTHQTKFFAARTGVHLIDYGASDSIQKMAQVALTAAPGRIAIVGHSMGGRVAWEILRTAPERIAGVAALDTAYRPRPDGDAGEREKAKRAELLGLARTKGMRAMAEFWMPGIIHPDRMSDAVLTGAILAMMSRKTPEIFAAQIQALLDRPDASPVLPKINCPALVLCGRKDTWSPLEGHQEIAALIPNSKLVVVEHCGHMAPMERPEDVTPALAAWFSSL
jgi:pimeloyl-ACP methyl ester carboxylesterase